ncbi:MAG: polysaccharide deacetylase family protein [bacterium]
MYIHRFSSSKKKRISKRSIPVLMYHHVKKKNGFITVTIENFEQQMRYIKEHNYNPITSLDLYNYLITGYLPAPKPILITFDDGFLDNYLYAFPILKKYNLKATIFAITSRIDEATADAQGNGEFCTWEILKEMFSSGLIDIQAHTHQHIRFDKSYDDKNRLLEVLKGDLQKAKSLIEGRLSKKCKFMAWPWGFYNQEYTELALMLGYQGMFTTKKGINITGGDVTRIKRFVIKDKDERWLAQRLFIYSHALLGNVYSKVVGKV